MARPQKGDVMSHIGWLKVLEVFAWVLGKCRDTDGDGTIDLLDKAPEDPVVQ